MRLVVRLVLALCLPLLLAASSASAGIDLTWNGCSPGAGVKTLDFTCSDPGFQAYLVGSFNLPADMDSFSSLEVLIDVSAETGALPDFWDFSAVPPGCNASGGMTRQLALPMGCGLVDPWGADGSEGDGTYVYLSDYLGNPQRARLLMSLFRVSLDPIDLAAGADYFGFSLLVSTANATEAGGSCAGCPSGVVFVWNWAKIMSETRPELEVIAEGPAGRCVRANGATTTTCDAVPVRRSTWGMLKSLYR